MKLGLRAGRKDSANTEDDWTTWSQSPRKDATNLRELMDNNVKAMLLHIQSLCLVCCFQNLKTKKQNRLISSKKKKKKEKKEKRITLYRFIPSLFPLQMKN